MSALATRRDVGITDDAKAIDDNAATLLDRGYCLIEDVIEPALVAALAADLERDFITTPMSQGAFYGSWTRRFHSLLRRSAHMDRFVRHPVVFGIAERVLGAACESIQLNLTQAIEILPGGKVQPPHRDQDMWPLRVPGIEYLVNVMWPFTPYTADTGATLVWPGSHRRQDEILLAPEEAIAAEMAPGSVLLFLGSTLHAGGANISPAPRRGMIVSYCLGWLKPYELPWLAYPPEIARAFPPELAALAGYRVHRPNLGTYEGQCPSALLRAERRAVQGAIDALRPDQEELIQQFYAGTIPIGDRPADGA